MKESHRFKMEVVGVTGAILRAHDDSELGREVGSVTKGHAQTFPVSPSSAFQVSIMYA